jgi:hypothetical protein
MGVQQKEKPPRSARHHGNAALKRQYANRPTQTGVRTRPKITNVRDPIARMVSRLNVTGE